jgi:hypothetical protein
MEKLAQIKTQQVKVARVGTLVTRVSYWRFFDAEIRRCIRRISLVIPGQQCLISKQLTHNKIVLHLAQ